MGYVRSKRPSVRAGGVLCLVFAILSAVVAGVIIYLVRFVD